MSSEKVRTATSFRVWQYPTFAVYIHVGWGSNTESESKILLHLIYNREAPVAIVGTELEMASELEILRHINWGGVNLLKQLHMTQATGDIARLTL